MITKVEDLKTTVAQTEVLITNFTCPIGGQETFTQLNHRLIENTMKSEATPYKINTKRAQSRGVNFPMGGDRVEIAARRKVQPIGKS